MQNLKSNPSKTVLTITVGFIIIYLVSDYKWALWVSACIGTLGLISSFLRRKIEWVWFKLAWLLSLIGPNIILTIVFYLILSPIALLRRAVSKTQRFKLKNTDTTFFQSIHKTFDTKSFTNPW